MYPNLYYMVKKLTGLENVPQFLSVIQTFGLFLAITFIVSGIILTIDMRRREALGQFKPITKKVTVGKPPAITDLLVNALIGFILGYKILYAIQNSSAFMESPQEVILSTQGSVVGGIIGALILAALKYFEKSKDAKKYDKVTEVTQTTMPHQLIGDIVILAAISGLIGAKIFALMETPEEFFKDPINSLLSGSGLAIYGGLIVAFFTVFFYVRAKGLNPVHMMDAAAPILLLGYGIGRMGCHFSGDGDWGIANTSPKPFNWMPDWLWSYTYPNNVLGQSADSQFADGSPLGAALMENCSDPHFGTKYCYELAQGVYPTSVYETLIMFGLFAIFWWGLRKRIVVPGVLFFIYMIVNGLERFWIETFRINMRYENWGNLTQAQIIATFLIVGGLLGVVVAVMRYRNKQKLKTS